MYPRQYLPIEFFTLIGVQMNLTENDSLGVRVIDVASIGGHQSMHHSRVLSQRWFSNLTATEFIRYA